MRKSIVLICLAVWCTTACQRHHNGNTEATKFQVTQAVEKDTLVYHEYVCQIRSAQHIELRALEKGYLQNIYVDEGQTVKKGQLLFQIMPVVYQAELERAEAEASTVSIEYQNTKSLADSNIVSKNELALAKAKLERAKAEVSLAKAHLSFTIIKAPFNGIVGRFNNVRLGSLLDEGEFLTTLSDNSKLWVYFNVPESEYLGYMARTKSNARQAVHLQMANNEIFPYEGIVETIEADFNNETGNIAFRATFPNPESILRHGQTGTILMASYLSKAVLIPQGATFEVLDKKFVYLVDENGVVKAQPISIGVELPHLYTVTQGITTDDRILIDGLRKVKNNDKIETRFVPFAKVLDGLTHLHAE